MCTWHTWGSCTTSAVVNLTVVSILIRRDCISCIFWLVDRQIRDKKLQLKSGWCVKTTSWITPYNLYSRVGIVKSMYFWISPEIGIFSVRLLVSKSLVLIREMNYATSSSTEPCSPTDLFRTFFVLVHFILHCNIKNSLLQRTLSIVPIFRNGNQVFPVLQQLHL